MPVADVQLHHFTPDEYGPTPYRKKDWWGQMNAGQLVRLDVFRGLWGKPVTLSQHNIALGRNDGPDGTSDHNVDRHGSVRAVDCFAGITTRQEATRAVTLAIKAGFTAIGLYPDWNGGVGLHLGIREGLTPQDPATWGGVERDGEQVYVSLVEALKQIERG